MTFSGRMILRFTNFRLSWSLAIVEVKLGWVTGTKTEPLCISEMWVFQQFWSRGKKNLGKLHDVFIPHAFQMLVYIVWIDGFRSQNYQITPLFRRNKSHSIHESGCLGNTTNESIECLISKQVPLLIGYILDGDTFHLWCYIEGTGDHLAEWALFMCAWCLFFLQTSRRCF